MDKMSDKLKSKEQRVWEAYWESEEVTKPDKTGNGRTLFLWVALIVLMVITGAVSLSVFGQPRNEVFYVVATPEQQAMGSVRFLCYLNDGQLLPRMTATWVRENGQTVTDSTGDTGCTMIPASEPVGVFDHVHQTIHWVWPGSLPVCVNIADGGIYSGNLCPPVQQANNQPAPAPASVTAVDDGADVEMLHLIGTGIIAFVALAVMIFTLGLMRRTA
jgi:hypothetical protein